MPNKTTIPTLELHDLEPREVIGRDIIARFEGQFRGASYACLAILEGNGIDRVYCDYHDDFVQRELVGVDKRYHFFQVKTKGKRNHQWGVLDLFGIYKKKPKDKIDQASLIEQSFVGRLLIHAVRFKDSCSRVVFLTNVHVDDDIEEIINAIEAGDFSNKYLKTLVDNFNDALCGSEKFDDSEIKNSIGKLSFQPGEVRLGAEAPEFEALATHYIREFSEIDLDHAEAKGIVESLISLVRSKSFRKILSAVSEKELDEKAGIGIDDLLEILSISKGAYHILRSGGEINAIRSASIIQRKLSSAGFSKESIEYCSRCKIEWDVWWRDKRHFLNEFDLNFLQESLNEILQDLIDNKITLLEIQRRIIEIWQELDTMKLTSTLNRDLLVGGIFSALVRSES